MGPDGTAIFGAEAPAVTYNATHNEYLIAWQGSDDSGILVDHEFEIFGQRFASSAVLRLADAARAVDEGAGTITIEVERLGDTSNTVMVNFAASNGTATDPADYTAAAGTLTFNAGETGKTFSLAITDDTEEEDDETVNIALSNPLADFGEVMLDGAQPAAVLTILDDDATTSPFGSGGGAVLWLIPLLIVTLGARR